MQSVTTGRPPTKADIRFTLKNARTRARKYNVPFSLTRDDIVYPETCPVLGIPLLIGGQGGSNNSPTLDRIDPALGYVPGNIIVVSMLANRIKSSATTAELMRVACFYEHLINRERPNEST